MISRKKMLIMFGTILLVILLSNIFGYVDNNYKIDYDITIENINFEHTANLDSSNIIKLISKDEKLKIVGEISNFYIFQLTTDEIDLIATCI